MDMSLKKAAMKKARAQGLSLSAVLNLAAQSFVQGNLQVGAFERGLTEARTDVKAGRIISQEKLFKRLGL